MIRLVCLLLCFGIANGDLIGSVVADPRALQSGGKMMKKYRYSDAAQTKGKDKSKGNGSSMMGKGKGSSSSKGLMMMMKKMTMMNKGGKGKGTPTTPPSSPYPTLHPTMISMLTPMPTLVETVMPTIEIDAATFQTCLVFLAVSDVNRDDFLNVDEYVRFINRWNGVTYVGEPFDDIDLALQDNYMALAQEEGIYVFGSKPGQTAEDDSHLRQFCAFTVTLLESEDVVTTTRAPTPAMELLLSECFVSLALSDADRNSQLVRTEYVTFVNRYTEDEDNFESFDEMEEILQENFFNAAPDEYVDISSALPYEVPTDELIHFCIATQEAVNIVFS